VRQKKNSAVVGGGMIVAAVVVPTPAEAQSSKRSGVRPPTPRGSQKGVTWACMAAILASVLSLPEMASAATAASKDSSSCWRAKAGSRSGTASHAGNLLLLFLFGGSAAVPLLLLEDFSAPHKVTHILFKDTARTLTKRSKESEIEVGLSG